MKIKLFGTRGSIPISRLNSTKYGGNTTCVRFFSEFLPKGFALVIDGGSGFVPMSSELLREGGLEELMVLLTHYHHDHTQGLPLSPLTFIKNIKMKVCGVTESGVGPREAMEAIMKPPFFPVAFKEVGSHFSFKGFDRPSSTVIVFHPAGGYKFLYVDEYERLVREGKNLPIGKGKFPVGECLVVTMFKSNHPEQTISYRFEEKPTGKVFVILTDHENGDGIPADLNRHLKGADLLVMDSQYTREVYAMRTAGFGHSTPDYCARVATVVGAKKLGLTHHDPNSTDADVDKILDQAEAAAIGIDIKIFSCADYQEVEV